MKVVIVTEGGKSIGFGHLTRCISLYEVFKERGVASELIVNGDDSITDLLRGKNYRIFNWFQEKDKLFKLVKNADVVIVDSYMADNSFYENISKLVETPVYIDDNKRLDYPRGIVVNGNIYAEELDYPKKNGVVYLLGTKYIPLRKEFWEIPEKEIKEKVESVMITFGGDDARNTTPRILRFLKKNCPNLKKNVIIGKVFQNVDEIKKETDKNTNLIYYPDAEKMKQIMLESDIAISAGGQTLYELARVGVPTMGICVAENQLGNAKGWEKAGFLEYTGWYKKSNFMEELKRSLEYLEDASGRKNKSKAGKEFVDGKGSFRVAKSLLFDWFKNNLSLREATLGDVSDILNLSNDDIVRKNSFNSEKIKGEDHLEWLKKKLDNKNCVFFIIVDNMNKFYGQIRFDINPKNKEAIINISLEKSLRGLGLSFFIIDKSISELLKTKNVRLIKAYIKEENILSIKAFEKANFRFIEDLTIRKNRAKFYTREIKYGI